MDKKNLPPKGQYILSAMEDIGKNGDAYTTVDELYQHCCLSNRSLLYHEFHSDLYYLQKEKKLHIEGRRIYLMRTWRYEEQAAARLAVRLGGVPCSTPDAPNPLTVKDITLTDSQRDAVILALSNQLSMVLGGAGTGKSTLINAVVRNYVGDDHVVLCAPTGKAARNLTQRTGLPARTVHSALGLQPNDDFLTPVVWNHTGLVVVDEASMLTLEMLAGILDRMNEQCQLVLVGDSNQLLSVGAGNVIADWLELGVPCARLETCHRQDEDAVGLTANVTRFAQINRVEGLLFGDSFQFLEMPASQVAKALTQRAAEGYLASDEDVQVLSPVNRGDEISVQGLNRAIAPQVNPRTPGMDNMPTANGPRLWDGDRVMITRNNREQNCSNGDVGQINICQMNEELYDVLVQLQDGRMSSFLVKDKMHDIIQAYAMTVHKAQGSEYDTVYIPIIRKFTHMLTRNWLYTAISRGKKRVVLFGDLEALDLALQSLPKQRRSMLVAKTRMYLHKVA